MDSRRILLPDDINFNRKDLKYERKNIGDSQVDPLDKSTNDCVNITHRSSLGLLPANVFADLSNVNTGVSFAYNNKLPDDTRYQLDDKEFSILRDNKQDITFKMPLPKPMQPTVDTSTMSPKNLSMKYLRPVNSDVPKNNPFATPGSPSTGWGDDKFASFVAKNSSINETSTKEVDWSNFFEKFAVQKNNQGVPYHSENDFRAFEQDARNFATLIGTKDTDDKSFSIEALSISMANRPRSTSFGGSPHETRNELAHTRNEGFSDFTNPPGSNFGSIAVNNTDVNSKMKDISYLEDSVFPENPSVDQMKSNKEKFSFGPFPSQSDLPASEFEANPSVSNNHDFINQAEQEFEKDHKFDQFDVCNDKNASKTHNNNDFSDISASAHGNHNEEQIDRLSASAYFAMSTSRLGSLEKVPPIDINSSSLSTNIPTEKEIEGRPNLGFSRIVSPKRRPVAVISLPNEENALGPKTLFEPELYKHPDSNLTTASANSTKCSSTRDSQRSSLAIDRTFKIPTAPKMDNKKDTLTLPRAIKNTSRNRHSSPIKRDYGNSKENIAPTYQNSSKPIEKVHNGPVLQSRSTDLALPNKEVTANVPFPVDIDKANVTWLAVESNKTEDKLVSIRNLTNQQLELRLIIRDSNQFIFKKDRMIQQNPYTSNSTTTSGQPTNDQNVMDTILQGNETKDVVIQFGPTSCAVRQVRGKLVIKPRRMNGKSLKASVPLCGYVGSPKIEFDDSFKTTVGHIPNHITTFIGTLSNNTETIKDTIVYNKGDVSAFVRIQAFADMDCRVACGNDVTDPIRVEPNAFILNPDSCQKITIRILPDHRLSDGHHTVVGSMLIISGPEICRQALRRQKRPETNKHFRRRHLVRGVDFDVPFNGENELMAKDGIFGDLLTGDEESDFEMKITTTSVNVVGLKSKGQFISLQVEDTLSESRINCTILGGSPFDSAVDKVKQSVRNYDTIREEEEIEIPPKKNFATTDKSSKVNYSIKQMPNTGSKTPSKSTAMENVKLKSNKLFFPPVKVGKSGVEKLIIENREHKNMAISIQNISSPFKTSQKEFEVKSKSYLKIPITYSPDDVGKHRGKVLLMSDCGLELEACLIGDSLK